MPPLGKRIRKITRVKVSSEVMRCLGVAFGGVIGNGPGVDMTLTVRG
jgi:hypothetical protein